MPRDSFSIHLISEQFTVREVLSMSNSKSTDLDDVSVKLLKLSIYVIGDILTHIMNCSIESVMLIGKRTGHYII